MVLWSLTISLVLWSLISTMDGELWVPRDDDEGDVRRARRISHGRPAPTQDLPRDGVLTTIGMQMMILCYRSALRPWRLALLAPCP